MNNKCIYTVNMLGEKRKSLSGRNMEQRQNGYATRQRNNMIITTVTLGSINHTETVRDKVDMSRESRIVKQ